LTPPDGPVVTRFRKKPVVIEAMPVTLLAVHDVAAWCGGRVILITKPSDQTDMYFGIDIPTLEGTMRADAGDWIIRGIRGEFYPCKPDIFEATYDPA